MAGDALNLFISYSRKDEPLKDELIKHLHSLQGVIWHDSHIQAGDEWEQQINDHLSQADIILLLVSADFLASDSCDREVRQALARHQSGEALVIPVILRPVNWQDSPLGKLQALPRDAKPITRWDDRDEAFVDVDQGVRAANERRKSGQTTLLPVQPSRRRLIKLLGFAGVGVGASVGSAWLGRSLLQFSFPSTSAPSAALPPAPAPANSSAAPIQSATPATPPAPTPPAPFSFSVIKVNASGQEIDRYQSEAQGFQVDLGGVPLEMVIIAGGSVKMGSSPADLGYREEEAPKHSVTVASFAIGKYPITQTQWRTVANFLSINRMLDPDPSRFKGDDRPVETVSWHDAVEFCARLARYTQQSFRLPSEAEWEYACRAGTPTPFHFGDTLTPQLANYSRSETTPVGAFGVANPFGLYDMHGNVWECCADHWRKNYVGAPGNGSARIDSYPNFTRVIRGGSWFNDLMRCRSAHREYYYEDLTALNFGMGGSNFGLRVACSVKI